MDSEASTRQADLCLHELFEDQARRSPSAPAIEDTRTRLTYEELDRRADLLASYLREAGVRPGLRCRPVPDQESESAMSGTASSMVSITLESYSTHSS